MLHRFPLIPERHGQMDRRTDGQTDIIPTSISRVSMLTRDKNGKAAALDDLTCERLKYSR